MRKTGKFEKIFEIINNDDVAFVYLLFLDIKGHFHSIQVPSNEAYRVFSYGLIINISDIEGFEGEGMVSLSPDLDTFVIQPWHPQQGKCACVICQINTLKNEVLNLDSRIIAEHIMKKCISKELFFEIIPSIQFYMFHTDENGMPLTITHDKSDEYAYGSADLGTNLRRDIALTLEDCGIMFSSFSTKKDEGLQEINLHGKPIKTICDNINFCKSVCQIIGKRHGLYASFIPKPINSLQGSKMQLKFICQNDEEKNVFYDENDKNKISFLGYSFIAGILKYIREIAIITNPLTISYKRLASTQVPNCVAWSSDSLNNSVILQIAPSYIESDVMIQVNSVDMSCNPYLALSLLLEAGLEGIINKLIPPQEVTINLFDKTDDELEKLGIIRLPLSMGESIDLFKKSAFAKKILGEDIFNQIIVNKEKEWAEYRKVVSEWEIKKYIYEY